jgi:hypothetical protein
MSSVREKLRHELRELIPVTLFFLVTFELLALTQMLMLEQYGIRVVTFLTAAGGALVVAKVVLLADHVPFIRSLSGTGKPLVYPIAWKTGIYFLASLVVRCVEHIIHFWRSTGSFADANRQLVEEVVWPHVLGVQLWLLVLLIVFCTVRELIGAIGRKQMIDLFFTGARTGAERPAQQADGHDLQHAREGHQVTERAPP